MSYICGVQTRPARYMDPEPAEVCETEVEYEGELCSAHEEPDDDFCYERYLEDKAEREADPDYYRDFGDRP